MRVACIRVRIKNLAMAGLSGIRVLELADGLGVAWVGKLFADLGADVIRVESINDSVRQRPHNVNDWINTSKRSKISCSSDLALNAHLVIHGPNSKMALGLPLDELSLLNPQLVILSLTAFGVNGPYSGYKCEEINLIHGSSWGYLSPAAADDPDLAPLKAPGHHATLNVCTMAATVALATIEDAAISGIGDVIDFSMFAAAAKITEFAPAAVSYLGVEPSRLGLRTVAPWGIFTCSDGRVQLICPEQSQWEALLDLIGNPDWGNLEIFATTAQRSENADLLNIYLSDWFLQQKVKVVCTAAQNMRIALAPLNTMAQLSDDHHLAHRKFFTETLSELKLLGPGFMSDDPIWAIRAKAPKPGEHETESWKAIESDGSPMCKGPKSQRPLEGITVCDFTWIWAGPLCTQILGHLGADVIKLESPTRPCMFRRLPFSPPKEPVDLDTSGAFQIYNSDKRSFGVDITRLKAKEVIERIISRSEVVIDNFGVGTMEKLGFSKNRLRFLNPEIVTASLSGFGQTGPNSRYTAYGPSGGAAAGLYSSNGYKDEEPRETGIAVADPCTGITAAWAVVVSLAVKRRTQTVAHIDVSMVEAVAATLGEMWMEYISTGFSPTPAGNSDSQWAPHGCYPSKGHDEWVTIACTSDEEWRGLCETIGDGLIDDQRFLTEASRKSFEKELDEIIETWTRTIDKWEVTERLQHVEVAAFPSLSPSDLWIDNSHMAASGMLSKPLHRRSGRPTIPGIPWHFSNRIAEIDRAAPLLGQHTKEIARELGIDEELVSMFIEEKLLFTPQA